MIEDGTSTTKNVKRLRIKSVHKKKRRSHYGIKIVRTCTQSLYSWVCCGSGSTRESLSGSLLTWQWPSTGTLTCFLWCYIPSELRLEITKRRSIWSRLWDNSPGHSKIRSWVWRRHSVHRSSRSLDLWAWPGYFTLVLLVWSMSVSSMRAFNTRCQCSLSWSSSSTCY